MSLFIRECLTGRSTSLVRACLVYEIIGFDTSIALILIDRFTRNRHDNGLTNDIDVVVIMRRRTKSNDVQYDDAYTMVATRAL
jgi:hypothetical protein